MRQLAPPGLGGAAAVLTGVAALTGCSVASSPAPDDFGAWNATPLRPDRALATIASTDEWCESRSVFLNDTLPPPFAAPMHVLVQDRRTPRTAAFVVTNEDFVGSCLVSLGGAGFGSLQQGVLPALDRGLAVDGEASGLAGAGEATWVWGRSAVGTVTVDIDLGPALHAADDDDRVVRASMNDGYWIGWWPDAAVALQVTARDALGNVIASIRHSDDGWFKQ